MSESNRRPRACWARALPTELNPLHLKILTYLPIYTLQHPILWHLIRRLIMTSYFLPHYVTSYHHTRHLAIIAKVFILYCLPITPSIYQNQTLHISISSAFNSTIILTSASSLNQPLETGEHLHPFKCRFIWPTHIFISYLSITLIHKYINILISCNCSKYHFLSIVILYLFRLINCL